MIRLPSALFWTILLISALTTVRTDAQSSINDGQIADSAYSAAIHQYHSYIAPEPGLYRGIQYVDYDYTVQRGQPFWGPDSIRVGSVWYNGIGYAHVRMLYDLVRDEVVILDPFGIYKISLYSDLIDSFMLDGHSFIRIRDSLAPSFVRSGFSDLIYRGRLIVIKRERKVMKENLIIPVDNVRLLIDSSVSFYIIKDGVYHPVNTKRELYDLLKDKRTDVRRAIRRSEFSWRSDKEQLLKLVAAMYDGVNH